VQRSREALGGHIPHLAHFVLGSSLPAYSALARTSRLGVRYFEYKTKCIVEAKKPAPIDGCLEGRAEPVAQPAIS
jgi:hypothetical protein